jgi:hypothetical protein
MGMCPRLRPNLCLERRYVPCGRSAATRKKIWRNGWISIAITLAAWNGANVGLENIVKLARALSVRTKELFESLP